MSDYIRVSWYCAIQTTKDPQQLKTTFNSYAISICELKRRSSGTLSFYSQHKRVTMTPQCTQSFIVNQSHCSVLIQVRLFTQIPAFVAEKMRIGDLQIRGHSKKKTSTKTSETFDKCPIYVPIESSPERVIWRINGVWFLLSYYFRVQKDVSRLVLLSMGFRIEGYEVVNGQETIYTHRF